MLLTPSTDSRGCSLEPGDSVSTLLPSMAAPRFGDPFLNERMGLPPGREPRSWEEFLDELTVEIPENELFLDYELDPRPQNLGDHDKGAKEQQ